MPLLFRGLETLPTTFPLNCSSMTRCVNISLIPFPYLEHLLPQVELSFDLGDPCIAVCHPSVLALFSDNFDLQTLDALTSEILESDLVDSTVYMERLEGRAVGRVTSPHSLLEAEQRLLERWFHPQVYIEETHRIMLVSSRYHEYQKE